MNKLTRFSALESCNHLIRNYISLRKGNDVLASTKLCFFKNYGTAPQIGSHSLTLKQTQGLFIIQKSSCGCKNRSLLANDTIVKSSLLRRFKSQTTGQNNTVKIDLWKRLALVGTVGGIVAYGYYSINRDREIQNEEVRYKEFKKAELGGDWTLTDHHGKQRSSKEFRGQWILKYFGFSHCPDICPEELEKLVQIVKHFDNDPKLPSMMPIFITLDPERDTPPVIKEYLADYKCPRLLGFTASSEDVIREVATKFRAYFSKGPPDEDNDYIVDHTIIIYLINPKGEFVNYFDRSRSAERIIKTVTDHIHKYNELEGRGK